MSNRSVTVTGLARTKYRSRGKRVQSHDVCELTPVSFIGPILWGHSGPLCRALSSLLLLWTSILHRFILVVVSTVATPGEWQCKIRTGGVRRLAVANGPNIFQMLLVITVVMIQKSIVGSRKFTIVIKDVQLSCRRGCQRDRATSVKISSTAAQE